jgi:uncharacterized delta-60 repeat protein/MYXO-CTERM domain-containing protein
MKGFKAGMAGFLLLTTLAAQALTESSMTLGKFASAGAGSTNWHASAPKEIIPIATGYLVIGNDEVSSNATGYLTTGSTLYALKLTSGLSRDTSYGTNGVQALSLPSGYYYRLPDVHVLASGKFLVAAEAVMIDPPAEATGERFILAQFNADTTPDTSFGSSGSVIVSMPCNGTSADVPSLAVQSTGKIVLTGTTLCAETGRTGFMTRFSASGVRETGFGTSGYLLINPRSTNTWLTQATIDGDGRLLVAGESMRSDIDGTVDSFVSRITLGTTPQVDTSFNTTGHHILVVGGADDAWATSLVMDGTKILVASSIGSATGETALTRLLSTGALDTSMGTTGTVLVSAGTYTDSYVRDIVLAGSGYYLIGALNSRRAIVKVTDAGALDTTDADFGATGYWRSSISNASAYLRGVLYDGKLLAAGMSINSTGTATESGNDLEDTSYVISSFSVTGDDPSTVVTESSSSGGGSADWLGLLLLGGLLAIRRRIDIKKQ